MLAFRLDLDHFYVSESTENVVDSLPPETVWVVQNLPFMSVCSKKPESVVEIEPSL